MLVELLASMVSICCCLTVVFSRQAYRLHNFPCRHHELTSSICSISLFNHLKCVSYAGKQILPAHEAEKNSGINLTGTHRCNWWHYLLLLFHVVTVSRRAQDLKHPTEKQPWSRLLLWHVKFTRNTSSAFISGSEKRKFPVFLSQSNEKKLILQFGNAALSLGLFS